MNKKNIKKVDNSLRNKIITTILIIMAYRFVTFVPLPFIDPTKIAEFSNLVKNGVFGMFNMLSGGSISRISVLALGIMPYITSSIIIQLLSASSETLKKLKQDGEAGQKKINNYMRYLTIAISLFQGFMMATGFVNMGLYTGYYIFYFKIYSAFVMMTGTVFLLWLSDICTAKGVGNGTSIIICTGILAEAPRDLINVLSLSKSGSISPLMLLALFAIFIATIVFVIFAERSNRLITIQYPRQAYSYMGKMDDMSKHNFLPLKLNAPGVIPPIFASAILLFPATIASISEVGKTSSIGVFLATQLTHGKPLFAICYSALIVFFCFFYNNVIFEVDDISNNLKKSGVFVPGYRPGTATSELLRKILNKLALVGASYLVIICMIPELLSPYFGYSFLLGGTGVLIVVNVIIDTIVGIQTQIMYAKYYKNMGKKVF